MRFLVIGTGISGIGAARLLLGVNEEVILYDSNDKLSVSDIRKKVGVDGAYDVVTGELKIEFLQGVDVCVISPGISVNAPFLDIVKKRNIKIWGEVELAYHYSKGEIVAITGTNGKTTTTSLVGEIMRAWKDDSHVFVVGNIGTPYTEATLKMTDDSITVAEISSFQLETAYTFHPRVSAILNITPDHLDRHGTMENYILTKESITKNQTSKDTCVLNYEDEVLRKFGETLHTKVIYFSSHNELEKGIFLRGEDIIYRDKSDILVCKISELKLIGEHNYENVMAAAAMAIAMGVDMKIIKSAICNFKAIEHRIEYVATKNGVKYYNDSKGTNPDSAIKAIKAMKGKTVLIGGGYDKNSDYTEWIKAFCGKVKLLILMGQTREKIKDCANKLGFYDIQFVDSMEEAVNLAAKTAADGEAVLLSPACASWGMFQNYEERGRIFKQLVNNI